MPDRVPEPEIPGSSSASGLRTTVYALLALTLVAGAWVRFDAQIASLSPTLAGPAAPAAERAAQAGRPGMLAELALLPAASAQAAVATLGLPSAQSASLAADLRRERLRMVALPVFDAGAGGAAPVSVLVSSGGYSRVLRLTRQPVVLTLPIDRVGTVSFQIADAGAGAAAGAAAGAVRATIGLLTLTGPRTLDGIGPGDVVDVGVVAQ